MISSHIFRKYHRGSLFLIVIPLVLSSFTHLWNPIGFPAIWVVEGQYMQRAMSVLDGIKLEESIDINPRPYDHPFFGQIFLAGVLAVIGYPELFVMNIPTTDVDNTVKILYSVPSEIAEKVGLYGIEKYEENGSTWRCGINKGGETPTLMLGLAGIGYFYLQLIDSLKISNPLMLIDNG